MAESDTSSSACRPRALTTRPARALASGPYRAKPRAPKSPRRNKKTNAPGRTPPTRGIEHDLRRRRRPYSRRRLGGRAGPKTTPSALSFSFSGPLGSFPVFFRRNDPERVLVRHHVLESNSLLEFFRALELDDVRYFILERRELQRTSFGYQFFDVFW